MSAHEHWDITVDTPVGQQRGSLELRVTEAACTGRLYSEAGELALQNGTAQDCLLYTSPSPRDRSLSRMPSSA